MQQEEQIIRTEYSELMQKSYIDYAMSVIIARALPDVRDGLKPVQRRTLWSRRSHMRIRCGTKSTKKILIQSGRSRRTESCMQRGQF